MAAVTVDLELADDMECGFFPGSCGLEERGRDLKALNLEPPTGDRGTGRGPAAISADISTKTPTGSPVPNRSWTPWRSARSPQPAQWLEGGVNELNARRHRGHAPRQLASSPTAGLD